MDNAEFRKLVHDRAELKSSKEIARTAVEAEFERNRNKRRGHAKGGGKKRKRGGRGGADDYSSDSGGGGSSGDDSDDDDGNKKKQRDRKKKKEDDDGDEEDNEKELEKQRQEELAHKYRDRAKERREGHGDGHYRPNADEDAELDRLMKYDGGEGRGDDKKRPAAATATPQHADDGNEEQENQQDGPLNIENAEQAKAYIAEVLEQRKHDATTAVASQSSDLEREMVDYLSWRYRVMEDHDANVTKDDDGDAEDASNRVTAAGLAIQRSTLTFSLQADPRDTAHSWQVPRQETFGGYGNAEDVDISSRQMTPVTGALLDQIDAVLGRSAVVASASAAAAAAGTKTKASTAKRQKAAVTEAHSDDSDDDIFGTVGEYDPTSLNKAMTATTDDSGRQNGAAPTVGEKQQHEPQNPKGEASATTKSSVFDSLLSEPKTAGATAAANSEAPSAILPRLAFDDDDNEDNDQANGGEGSAEQQEHSASGPSNQRLVGFSSTHEDGGDDFCGMDMDFDGRMEDEEEEEKEANSKKKKKKKKRKNRERSLSE